MNLKVFAAVTSAACMLSACGFVPPTAPLPDESKRVPINRVDPRSQWARPSALAYAPALPAVATAPEAAPLISASPPPAPTTSTPADGASPAPLHTPVPRAPTASATSTLAPRSDGSPGVSAEATAVPRGAAHAPTETLASSVDPALPAITAQTAEVSQVAVVDATTQPTVDLSAPASTAAPADPPEPPLPQWTISPADQNLRLVIARWAETAGWTFAPEYWTVPVDIPITASHTWISEFQEAVRGLLETTELTDRPLQPCFYSNRVVRVVPITQACNRTQ